MAQLFHLPRNIKFLDSVEYRSRTKSCMTYCARPGYLLKSWRTSSLGTMNLHLDISTHESFDSTSIFHTLVHSVRLSRDLTITRSFRESSSHFSQKSSEIRTDPLWTLSPSSFTVHGTYCYPASGIFVLGSACNNTHNTQRDT